MKIMKSKTLLLLLISGIMILESCKKTSAELNNSGNTVPIVTAPGNPIGDAATKKIGKDGGSLLSADGKTELIIPAGALSAETDIVIQAISNQLPGGINSAYRFSPEGLSFSKAVTVNFHYSSDDAAATTKDLMGIAFQDSVGGWWRLNNFTNDDVHGILSAPIWHFSNWSAFDMLQLIPTKASVATSKSLNLQIEAMESDDDFLVDDLRSPDQIAPLKNFSKTPVIWSVNAVVNGNAQSGTISSTSIPGTAGASAVFTAPVKVPAQNPVAVTAEVDLPFKYHGKTFNKTTLVSNITITGAKYLLEIVERRDDLKMGIWVTDSASMLVDLTGDQVVISDIRNFAPVVALPNSAKNELCTFSYVQEGTGDINITAATGEIRVQSSTERALQIFYTQTGTVDYSYRQYCVMPTGVFDVTTPNVPNHGTPISSFFNLTDDVVHDDDLSLPFFKLEVKLSLIK
jgi:hypothetical protein